MPQYRMYNSIAPPTLLGLHSLYVLRITMPKLWPIVKYSSASPRQDFEKTIHRRLDYSYSTNHNKNRLLTKQKINAGYCALISRNHNILSEVVKTSSILDGHMLIIQPVFGKPYNMCVYHATGYCMLCK